MRPTGRLHIGHYFGALQNWVRLQNDSAYECFYFIADWHALTSDYANTSDIAQNVIEIVTDYLASGLDPKKSVIFQQSLVAEHAELHLLLSMVTPLGWLERVPTYKEALENIKDKDLHTYGFLGYPTLQTADIVMYSEPGTPLIVPVGEDQVSHVELSREIVRRFNSFWGWGLKQDAFSEEKKRAMRVVTDVLSDKLVPLKGQPYTDEQKVHVEGYVRSNIREVGLANFARPDELRDIVWIEEKLTQPQAMLTQTPRIPGLDGRKMSKSYGNTIMLSESDEDIRKKTKVMVTDPARKRRTDPGNPDVCPVGDWHKLFSKDEPGRLDWMYKGCTTAGIGCIECKAAMAENLIKWIAPVRERRVKWENDWRGVLEVIDEGSQKARKVAQGTMDRVREAVFRWKDKRKEIAGT